MVQSPPAAALRRCSSRHAALCARQSAFWQAGPQYLRPRQPLHSLPRFISASLAPAMAVQPTWAQGRVASA